jgi:Glu-tRNA(Gln) amidotransferase subunit E-like FAD-binding protein
MTEITLKEVMNILYKVYEEESEYLLKAESNQQIINYIVGKIMVESKGRIDPRLAINMTKAVVLTDIPNTKTTSLELVESKTDNDIKTKILKWIQNYNQVVDELHKLVESKIEKVQHGEIIKYISVSEIKPILSKFDNIKDKQCSDTWRAMY